MRYQRVLFSILVFIIVSSNCYAATRVTLTVTATVLQGQNSLSVDTTTVNFGTVTPSPSHPRYFSNVVNVTYFPGARPWTIRVYTANPGNLPGLIGVTDPDSVIPLKVWTANYGPRLNPTGHAPDPNNPYFWKGYDFNGNKTKTDIITDGSINEIALGFDVDGDGLATHTGLGTLADPVSEEPVWLSVPDYAEMKPGDPYTWRRLLTSAWVTGTGPGPGPGGSSGNPYTFPVFFGIDVTNIAAQQYSTSTLTFEMINE